MARKLGKFLVLTAAVSTAAAAAIYYMRKKASDAELSEEEDYETTEEMEDSEIRSYVQLHREDCEECSCGAAGYQCEPVECASGDCESIIEEPAEEQAPAQEVIEKTEEFFGADTQ